MSEVSEKQYGKLYWFAYHCLQGIKSFLKQHRIIFILLAVILLICLFNLRAVYQPLILELRKNIFIILVAVPLIFLFSRQISKGSIKRKFLTTLLAGLLTAVLIYGGSALHSYLSLYYRYQTLSTIELAELPISGHERIQPKNSIFSLAHEVMSESESPMTPDFVKVGEQYRWTIAIEPAYPISRTFGSVKEIINVSGTAPSPSFTKQNRIPVEFDVGENLMFGRNTYTCVIRSFGLWRFLNYQPTDVTYFTDQNGEWLQVVKLIRWRGIVFPRPEFGGVQIIRQGKSGFISDMRRVIAGKGKWIKPAEIEKHPYLKGESILSYDVSRYIANSFRFQNGFFAPFPGYHEGDVRIPDMAADLNDQPFTTYFEKEGQVPAMLYHYFALEPFHPEKQGLNTSLFIPADGSSQVYVYRHHEKAGSLIGVSAISAKVMESKKNYNWERNRPVEHRPFIRHIAGKLRFFWLTTVVTKKESSHGSSRFIAGSVPDVVLTDAEYNTPIWVDPDDPAGWTEQVESEMQKAWSQN